MAVTEVLVPRTSDAMTEAVMSKWLVATDSAVTIGDVIAEVETDKALVEITAEASGLLITRATEGTTVEVGAVLAYLLDGDDVAAYHAGDLTLGPTVDLPVDSRQTPDEARAPASPQPAERVEAEVAEQASPVFSSPLARRLARERGLTLTDLAPGTGPNGRIVRADILRHENQSPRGGPGSGSARQRSMVNAMVSSKAEIPHFYLFRDIDLGAVRQLRKNLADADLSVPSVSVFLIKALGVALNENAFARRRWIDDRPHESEDANVGIAVADGIDEIVVPVIRSPASLSLAEVASELKRLSDAVRSHALRLDDTSGAVATISNLGMFGVDALLPIIPPTQTFILGIGRDRLMTVLDGQGQVQSRWMSTFSLAGDHRVMTGLGGARILDHLDQLLQHPVAFLANSSMQRHSEST